MLKLLVLKAADQLPDAVQSFQQEALLLFGAEADELGQDISHGPALYLVEQVLENVARLVDIRYQLISFQVSSSQSG